MTDNSGIPRSTDSENLFSGCYTRSVAGKRFSMIVRHSIRSCLLVLAALLLLIEHARAWGDLGHKVICEIAFRLAKPNTQVELRRLVNSDQNAMFPDFSESCVLPDHQRTRPSEHYINLPRDSSGFASESCPLADKCVLTAILSDFKIVSSKLEPDASRLFALESLGHWVGDIHQPMHVSFLDDRGGNTIKASGCGRNLHAVWDSCLVEATIGADPNSAATRLLETITLDMGAKWNSSRPRDWANETLLITKSLTTEYCVTHGNSCDSNSETLMTITAGYIETNKPVVRAQLLKAGVRLAHLLDAAFGD